MGRCITWTRDASRCLILGRPTRGQHFQIFRFAGRVLGILAGLESFYSLVFMRHLLLACLGLLVVAEAIPAFRSGAIAQSGTLVSVQSIADGDTLRVKMNGKSVRVRAACADAPEVAHNAKERGNRADRNQYQWGERAKQRLNQLLAGNQVLLDITDTDQYGRKVAEIRLPNGTFVQQTLVAEGLAVAYRRYYKNCPSSH